MDDQKELISKGKIQSIEKILALDLEFLCIRITKEFEGYLQGGKIKEKNPFKSQKISNLYPSILILFYSFVFVSFTQQ